MLFNYCFLDTKFVDYNVIILSIWLGLIFDKLNNKLMIFYDCLINLNSQNQKVHIKNEKI